MYTKAYQFWKLAQGSPASQCLLGEVQDLQPAASELQLLHLKGCLLWHQKKKKKQHAVTFQVHTLHHT